MERIKKLLIIPDGHCSPKYDNERWVWLGRFIIGEKPDVIVNLGDFADMPSLSSYDKGKGTFLDRRYTADIDSAVDGLNEISWALDKENLRLKKQKKGSYTPRKVMHYGNHEWRILRATNESPELIGKLSLDDLSYKVFGWETCPYRQEIAIGGVVFSHDYATGISGRPIGGESIAKTLIHKNLMSSVQGHSHVFDHSERTRIDGRKVFGLSAGCFTHPDMIEDWNIQTHHLWWRGVVVLHGVEDGYYDKLEAVTMRDLESKLGVV